MKKLDIVSKIYKRLLKDHLVLVQSIQTGLLIGTGDLLAQTAVEQKKLKHINFVRTGQFVIMGVGFVGPALTIWYKFLSKIVKKSSSNKAVVLKKVAMDQLIFAPVSLFIFVTLLNTLQGKDWTFIKNQLQLKYTTILFTNYAVWPFVQIVNFRFIPLQHQVLFVQVLAIFWNTFLSWKTQQDIKH